MEWWQRLAAKLGMPALILRVVHPAFRIEASGVPPHMPGWFCEAQEISEGQRLFVCSYPPVYVRENLGRLSSRLIYEVSSGVVSLVPTDTFYTILVTPSTLTVVATETEWYSSEAGKPEPTATLVCVASDGVRICLPGGISVDGEKATIFVDAVACLLDESCMREMLVLTRELFPHEYPLLARLYTLMSIVIKKAYEVLGTDLDTIAFRRFLENLAIDPQLVAESIWSLGTLKHDKLKRIIDVLERALRDLDEGRKLMMSARRFNLEAFGLRVQ